MIVNVLDEAARDLEAIIDFIALDNPARAISFGRELREACLGLADYPRRFPFVVGREADKIRRRIHRGYLILCRTSEDAVFVIRIVHASRDYAALLSAD